MVAWGGIEPPTQGFSEQVAAKKSMFTVPVARKCAMCYAVCYSENKGFWVFRSTQKTSIRL